jgi:hypothetical protein
MRPVLLIMAIILCIILPASAVTYCWDYVFYKVTGQDSNGLQYNTLVDKIKIPPYNYQRIDTFSPTDSMKIAKWLNSLRKGDIIFLGTEHVGYVTGPSGSSGHNIAHYIQIAGQSGKARSLSEIEALALHDDLGYFIASHFGNLPGSMEIYRPSGLVAYYSFNDGTARDDSGNGNDGQLQGGATIVPGMIENSVSLDGISGSVNVLNAQSFNVGDQLTVSFWMKPDANNAMNMCCQGLVTTDYYGLEISGGTDPQVGVNFFTYTNGPSFYHTSDAIGGGWPVSSGQWHHVIGTYDGSTMKLYIGGSLVAERSQSGDLKPMVSTSFLSIGSEDGRTYNPSLAGTRYFNGLIDEVAIYNQALSADEIASMSKYGISA